MFLSSSVVLGCYRWKFVRGACSIKWLWDQPCSVLTQGHVQPGSEGRCWLKQKGILGAQKQERQAGCCPRGGQVRGLVEDLRCGAGGAWCQLWPVLGWGWWGMGQGSRRTLLNLVQLLGMDLLNWACSFSKLLKKLSSGYLFQAVLVK